MSSANWTAIPVAGVITSRRSAFTRQARTSKSTGQLQRDWLGGAARRVGLAMTDQELLPTARNIPATTKKGWKPRDVLCLEQAPEEMWRAHHGLHTSPGSRRVSRLFRTEINLLTIDDVPGWMLMRKASLTQERRERLIAALPDEHFAINDVKRVLVRLFPELHINEHRESDGHSRRSRKRSHWDPRQRVRNENKRRTRVAAAVLSRLVTSGQTQTVLMTKPM